MACSSTNRLAVGALVVVAALVALASVHLGPSSADAASTGSRAVVVIDDGLRRSSYCIRFSGEIDGLDALRLAGAEAVVSSFGSLGGAVCSINGTGCSTSGCLTCQAPRHWNYLRARAGSGQLAMSPVGASSVTVRDGDVEGWIWAANAAPTAAPSVDSACGPRPTTTSSPPVTPPSGSAGTPEPAAPEPAPPGVVDPPSPSPGIEPAAPGDTTTSTDRSVGHADESTAGDSERDSPGGTEPPVTSPDEPVSSQAAARTGSSAGSGGGEGSWLGFAMGLAMVGAMTTWAVVLRRRRSA